MKKPHFIATTVGNQPMRITYYTSDWKKEISRKEYLEQRIKKLEKK